MQGIIFREQESQIGREEQQYGRVSELWAMGLNPGVGGLGGRSSEDCRAHLRFPSAEGQESRGIYPPTLVHHWLGPAPGALTPRGVLPSQLQSEISSTELQVTAVENCPSTQVQ